MNKLILFFLLFFNYSLTQNSYKIKYKYNVVDKFTSKSDKLFEDYLEEEIIFNNNYSLHKLNIPDTTYIGKDGLDKTRSKTVVNYLIKNFALNSMFHSRNPQCNSCIVKDSVGVFNWILKSNKSIILGYNCNEAITTFRGRTYSVFYTEELPFINGPFKFCGLPGMILKVTSDDGCVNIYAKTLVKIQDNIIDNEIVNFNFYMNKDKIITFEEFLKVNKKRRDKIIADNTDVNGTIELSARSIEIFLE